MIKADSDPLSVALAASRPIDDAPRVPLAVELLLSDHQRRPVTVEAHHAFRRSLDPALADEIDHLAADPALDRLPARRSEGAVGRVLGILDELERRAM